MSTIDASKKEELSEVDFQSDSLNQAEIKKKSENCCYKKDYINLVADLIWPVLVLVFITIFFKQVRDILANFAEFIRRVKTFEVSGAKFVAKEPDEIDVDLGQEGSLGVSFLKDLDLEDNIVDEEVVNIKKEKLGSDHNLENFIRYHFERKVLKFFSIFISPIELIIDKNIYLPNTRLIRPDALFVFNHTIYLVEVKFIDTLNMDTIFYLKRSVSALKENRESVSRLLKSEILKEAAVIIIPKEAKITNRVKEVMKSSIGEILIFRFDERSKQILPDPEFPDYIL